VFVYFHIVESVSKIKISGLNYIRDTHG